MKKFIIVEVETRDYLNIEKELPCEVSMVYVENNKIKDEIKLKENILKKGQEIKVFLKRNNINNEIEIVSDCGIFTKILLENLLKEIECNINLNFNNIIEIEKFIKEINNKEIEESLYKAYELHNDSLEVCYDMFKMVSYA